MVRGRRAAPHRRGARRLPRPARGLPAGRLHHHLLALPRPLPRDCPQRVSRQVAGEGRRGEGAVRDPRRRARAVLSAQRSSRRAPRDRATRSQQRRGEPLPGAGGTRRGLDLPVGESPRRGAGGALLSPVRGRSVADLGHRLRARGVEAPHLGDAVVERLRRARLGHRRELWRGRQGAARGHRLDRGARQDSVPDPDDEGEGAAGAPPRSEWLSTFPPTRPTCRPGAASFPAALDLRVPRAPQSRTGAGAPWSSPPPSSASPRSPAAALLQLAAHRRGAARRPALRPLPLQVRLPRRRLSGPRLPLVFQRLLAAGRLHASCSRSRTSTASGSSAPTRRSSCRRWRAHAPLPPTPTPRPRGCSPRPTRCCLADATIELLSPLPRGGLGGQWSPAGCASTPWSPATPSPGWSSPSTASRSSPNGAAVERRARPRPAAAHAQTLRAAALDAEGRRAGQRRAADQRQQPPLRGHPHRAARRASATARACGPAAKVELPEGQRLDRVEFFLNETLVATLYQAPFAQPILLPAGRPAHLPARGRLPCRTATDSEDLVFVNAPASLEELEVQFVELYTAVTDRNGRPAAASRPRTSYVNEDGVPQQLVRFEQVENLPIQAAILLDTSASMEASLDEAQGGRARLLHRRRHAADRAALITFNDRPRLQDQAHQRPAGAGRRSRRPQGRARHGALRQRRLLPLLLQRRHQASGR